MTVRIQKWGNSLAVRIPREMAKEAKLEEGSEVDLREEAGKITLAPVKSGPSLEELLSAITPENLHGETDLGGPRGLEAW